MNTMRASSKALVALALLVCHGLLCAAQDLPDPLVGQNEIPAELATVDVKVNVFVEKILSIDAKSSSYTAVWWVIMEWTDPTAFNKVLTSTAETRTKGMKCTKPCDDTFAVQAGCCDSLWLPSLYMPNFISQFSDLIPRYRISVQPATGLVRWAQRVSGTWYSPFDFRAFPLEHQHLMLQIQIADGLSHRVGLVMGDYAKLNATAHTKGPDLVGWNIATIHGQLYDSRECQGQFNAAYPAFLLAGSDPLADELNAQAGTNATVVPYTITTQNRYYSNNTQVAVKKPLSCTDLPYTAEWRAKYGPVILLVEVMVRRTVSYYVLGYLVPLMMIPFITLVIFAFPQNALADRMGVIVAMFLSLTAMQFVFDYPPSQYLNTLQQTSLMVYALLLLSALESLIVAKLVSMADNATTARSAAMRFSHFMATMQTVRSGKPRTRSGKPVTIIGKPSGATSMGGGGVSGKYSPASMMSLSASQDIGEVRDVEQGSILATAATKAAAAARSASGRVGGLKRNSNNNSVEMRSTTMTSVAATTAAAGAANPSGLPSPSPSMGHGDNDMADHATITLTTGPDPLSPPATTPGADTTMSTGSVNAGVPPSPFSAPKPQAASKSASTVPLHDSAADNRYTALSKQTSFAAGASPFSRNAGSQSGAPSTVLEDGEGAVMHDDDMGSEPCGGRCGSWCKPGGWLGRLACCRMDTWYKWFVSAPREFLHHCREDAKFAQYMARRVDNACATFFSFGFIIAMTLVLWLQTELGEHRLMLGQSRPGNM